MKELSDGGKEQRSQRWCPVRWVAWRRIGWWLGSGRTVGWSKGGKGGRRWRMRELSDGGKQERSCSWCPVRRVAEGSRGVAEELSGGGSQKRRAGGGTWKNVSDGGREERSGRWCPVHRVAEELLGGGWVAEDLSGGGREREEKRAGGGAWKNCQMVERRRGDGALCVG
jgi:hypothetical protein